MEITESWDGTSINGHCDGKPQPNPPSPRAKPANPHVARPMCPPNTHITSHQEAYQFMHPLQASTTVPSSCQATRCRSVVEILPQALPQLGCCASSGRLWAVRYSQEEVAQ